MDARIDNREELAKNIELPNRPLEEIGDSEFILAAYAKWGEECPKYLLGDFSFAIWDEKKQQLFCARDHIGIKTFFYFQNEEFFIFSNDISVLLQHPHIPQNFDDLTIANYVLDDDGAYSRNSTFFENIKKLPPATSTIICKKELKTKTYWRIEDSPPIRYQNFQEYVKKLRELFDDAVKMRLRSDYTIASHLSGGIDSSPIAVLSSRELGKQKKNLHVFNWIDIPEDLEKYEFEAWSFSRRIAAQEKNMIHEEFAIDANFMVKQYETHDIFTQGTMYYWEEYYIQDRIKEIGARVMLSGWGGDQLITYNGYSYISGLFSQRKILRGLYYSFKNFRYHDNLWSKFIKVSLKSILPPEVLKIMRKIVKPSSRITNNYEISHDTYLTDSFKDCFRAQQYIEYPTGKGVRKRQIERYNFGYIQERIESWNLSTFSKKQEYRYPLLDKRIVEFAIGIPEELFYPKKGKERPLFKTSIKNLLPQDIIWFNKPSESKANRTYKKMYVEALKVLQKKLSYQKVDYMKDNYFNYGKMLKNLQSFDFKKEDVYRLDKVLTPFLFLKAKIRLNKDKEHSNGK